jgi:NAD(P)-dependent dehydrogenase (short-subunit alcohol dehydrogenase family)
MITAMPLFGRHLLVAGGAAGIGRATALAARDQGARVAVLDRHAWTGTPAPDSAVVADVRDTASVDLAVADAAAELGALDGLVYCAGVDLMADITAMTDAQWERVIDINLTGAMRVCRAALRHFPAAGGTIVLTASGAALRPLPHRAAYGASKAGLVMLAKVLAVDLAGRGVRVNAICPGAVDTELFRGSWEHAADPQAELAMIRDRYALRRIATPDEIAAAALFLTAEASSYITGTALAVDGGRTFH